MFLKRKCTELLSREAERFDPCDASSPLWFLKPVLEDKDLTALVIDYLCSEIKITEAFKVQGLVDRLKADPDDLAAREELRALAAAVVYRAEARRGPLPLSPEVRSVLEKGGPV